MHTKIKIFRFHSFLLGAPLSIICESRRAEIYENLCNVRGLLLVKRYLRKNFFVKKWYLFLLALLSGILLALAWFPHGFIPLIFIGFVPLLLIEKTIYRSATTHHSLLLLGYGFLTFFTWNLLTTWWEKNASLGGAALALLCNSVLMTMVFFFYHNVKRRIGEKWEYLIFCSFWITWEYFHLHWDLSWPWLSLGNAFADTIRWIQWYEYTGIFGGSLWILTVNCIIASCFQATSFFYTFQVDKKKRRILVLLLLLPIVISFCISAMFSAPGNDAASVLVDAVVVQPNIDPYKEKFSTSPDGQLKKMLALAAQKTNSNTAYLVFPETALVGDIWEDELKQAKSIRTLETFLKQYPHLTIIIGAATCRSYEPGEARSATARKFTKTEGYYDAYNTALQLNNTGTIQVYHKSKLVPGVEKLPFPFIFNYLGDLSINLGGTSGSLGTQEERGVFDSPYQPFKVAPVICYESIYGEYVGAYFRNGANFMSIITNDGWWGDTPGYQQHLKYGALRAIETRSWIARSANTGISCFINPQGEIQQATNWWVPAVIKGKIGMIRNLTFYTRYGDYIAKSAMYLAVLLVIYSWLIRFRVVKK